MKKKKGILLFIILILAFFMLFILSPILKSVIDWDNFKADMYKNSKAEVINSLEEYKSSYPSEVNYDTNSSKYTPTGRYVFITLDNSKYHLSGCDYLDGRPYKVGLEWAQNNGYGACKYCNPYVENTNEQNKNSNILLKIILIIIIISCIITIIIICKRNKKYSNSHQYIKQTNEESNFEKIIIRILIVMYGIAVVAFSVLSTVIYIYTIYYYAVADGFWGAVLSFILPGFSSIWLFFELLVNEGLSHIFTIMVLIWIISVIILIMPSFAKDKN